MAKSKGNGQENLGFDLEAWRNQGLEQIKALNSQIDEKNDSKRKIDEEIAVLVNDRTSIEKALGIKKSGNQSARVRIKPVLVQVFSENENTPLDFDSIVEKVQAEQPKANEKKIRGAFERWAAKDDRVVQTDQGWTFNP